ncbi:hypothetical protein BDY19DRAFT_1044799 [Irpex rosettiformis]|uniref:Uncharacterized protein n=1 Tax=Irpex rosettiformis TaxID=378272 RepID=A0ACB8UNJ5_9APHY|nr:hypothetical protein BDY19DRAFT_1044799 [Irpex rosettiformis]
MATSTNKVLARLSVLDDSLDELEAQLEPLFAQTLPETIIGLDKIQQAKLQVDLPYLVYDLVFIYLKTKGVDPKTHPVITELDRIRQYFGKIKDAEDPEKRRLAVDKGVANRFIKHAIAQVKFGRPPGQDEGMPVQQQDVRVPVKVTEKMIARAQYEKELKELGSEEEDNLEVIDDAESESSLSTPPIGDKGKERARTEGIVAEVAQAVVGQKRRRPAVDPFAGYGDAASPLSEGPNKVAKSSPERTDNAAELSRSSTPQSISDTAKAKKAAKKAKRKANSCSELLPGDISAHLLHAHAGLSLLHHLKSNALAMSYAHDIDNDNPIFDFDDSNEPLSPLDLEDSAPERHISISRQPTPPLSSTLMQRDSHTVESDSASLGAKGKSVASVGATSQPVSIPVVQLNDPETDPFSLSIHSAGPSSHRYEHLPPFEFQGVEAMTYLETDAVSEVPLNEQDESVSKGKGRELPPTLPSLSFVADQFSDSNPEWSSVAGPSSYGSAANIDEYSPLSPSSVILNVPMSSPVSSDIFSFETPATSRRRTMSNTSRRSLSTPTLPRMKVKFTGVKNSKGHSGTLARKLLFRKTPPSSPRYATVDIIQETANSSAMLSDLGYITAGNCLSPWSRSPLAVPLVETNSVWGIVDSRPIKRDSASNSTFPLRTKGRSYSSPLPLPPASIYDIVPFGPHDVFELTPSALPAYFDEYLPHELKIHIFNELLDLHEAEFQRRLINGKWTALKAASSRSKWVGRDKGYKELFRLSRVSRSWRELVFDGQLWSKFDLRAFPRVHESVLMYMSHVAGGFIGDLNLVGHARVSSETLIEVSHNLSVHPTLLGDLSSITHNQLTSLNLQGCSTLSARSLHHILIRSPLLERLCLKGQFAVTNTTCDVLANYCPKLVSLDLSRCPNMTGDGLRSALSYGVSRGEHVKLKQLRLSGLKKVTDETMRILGRAAPALEVLDLSYARDLHNSAIEAFTACTEDGGQTLEVTQLTAREAGRDPADTRRYWRRITRLRHLSLSFCVLLTDHACSHLAHAVPKLEFLELAGIGPDMRDTGLVHLLNTTPLIRRLDLEDATEVSDEVLEALTPSTPMQPLSINSRIPPPTPEPGHALEHLIVSYANIESEALSALIRACPRLRILEADNTRMTGITLREFVQTARERKIQDAKVVAVDCRGVGEYSVKEVASLSRPRMGWVSWHARKLGYLDWRDDEGLGEGQDECDSTRVVVKTFYSWQGVDAVQAAREKKRKSHTRRVASTGSTVSEDADTVSTPARARWWSPGGRRSSGPNTPTLLDLNTNTDRGDGCIVM